MSLVKMGEFFFYSMSWFLNCLGFLIRFLIFSLSNFIPQYPGPFKGSLSQSLSWTQSIVNYLLFAQSSLQPTSPGWPRLLPGIYQPMLILVAQMQTFKLFPTKHCIALYCVLIKYPRYRVLKLNCSRQLRVWWYCEILVELQVLLVLVVWSG